MVGKASAWFEKAMGPNVRIEWKSFNAGPSAIEALFAGAIDMTYTGPNPAINGYVRSDGQALRVIAGATSKDTRLDRTQGEAMAIRQNLRSLGFLTIVLVLGASLWAQTGVPPKKKTRPKATAAPTASQQDIQALRDLVQAQQKQIEAQGQQMQQLQDQLHQVLDSVQQANASAQKLQSGTEQAQTTAVQARQTAEQALQAVTQASAVATS